MRGQATCAVRTVARFLKALHKHGIYDQTTLVILADHGAGLPPLASSSSWTPKFQLLNAMADVLLLVKPAGSRGALATSWRPASLSDVSATICAESKACPMPTGGMALLGEPASHAARERQFMFYPWGFAEWTQDRVKVPERYRIVGRRVLQEAWLPAVPKREK
jgi:arylsulfatase A-like enzyme